LKKEAWPAVSKEVAKEAMEREKL